MLSYLLFQKCVFMSTSSSKISSWSHKGGKDIIFLFLGSCKIVRKNNDRIVKPGNTKGGSITVLLTSCLTGLDYSVSLIKTKIVSCHTADSKPVKQEVNGTVILPPLVFPGQTLCSCSCNFFGQGHMERKQP